MRALLGLCALLSMAPAFGDAPAAPAAPAAAAPAAPDCTLRRRAALDMEMDDTGRITVPVSINGTEKRMMVDTGASESLITAATVAELKLPSRKDPRGVYMRGFGGRIDDRVTDVAEFGFGKMKGSNFTLFIESQPMETSGLLGADFLYFFDLDFDFAKAKLNLIHPDHCPGKVVYWSRGDYGVVPFKLDQNHIMVTVMLDGQEVNAAIDTGATDTVMSLERAADSYDLDRSALKKSRHYPFKTLSFGGVSIFNPAIELVPDKESAVLGHNYLAMHMILGMGVLRRLHLYVSYKEKKIYVTPATQY
jgi:predicted aspartyl protease